MADVYAVVLRTPGEPLVAGPLAVDHERVPLRGATDAWTRQRAGDTDGRIVLIPEGAAA